MSSHGDLLTEKLKSNLNSPISSPSPEFDLYAGLTEVLNYVGLSNEEEYQIHKGSIYAE